jgi:elongation factor G
MKTFDTEQIRNVVFAGHNDTGKTTLISGMLFAAGAVNRFLRVEDGNTVTDFDEEEIARKISIQLGVANAEWKGHKVNFLDTPGFAIFIGETMAGMKAADAMVLAVNGVAGIEVSTDRLFKLGEQFKLPTVFVVTKMDKEYADDEKVLKQIHDKFGHSVIALQLPIGREAGFQGVVDLVTMKAHLFAKDGTPAGKETEIPADLLDRAKAAHDALVEKVAEGDEKLMEKFFEAGTLPMEDLVAGLKKGIASRDIMPVCCTSADKLVGLTTLLDVLASYLPPPALGSWQAKNAVSGEPVTLPAGDAAPGSAFVFKTISDLFAGRISIMKVASGTLKADGTYYNAIRETPERFGTLNAVQGKTLTPITEAKAGDIVAVNKLKETRTFDSLSEKAAPVKYDPLKLPEPSIAFAIEPKSKGDEDKISSALARIMEEDPVLRLTRDTQTKEIVLSGAGQIHIEIVVNKLKTKYGVAVGLKLPKVPYKETVTRRAETTYRHKKQSGGRGQFAECAIVLEPAGRGEGYEYIDEIFGGSIPLNFRPSVDKGIQATAVKGVLAGYPVVDFKVRLVDGKFHPVDSSDRAFQIAGSMGFKEAFAKAGPTLLEPIFNLEIVSPEEFTGDIMGDLNGRRGRVQGMDVEGDSRVVKAQAPLAEILTYSSDLRSMTQGRGSFSMEFSHYEEVPKHAQEKIIAAAKKEKAGETEEEE